MKILGPVSEAEALGEFLRNEFYEPEYNCDRDQFEGLVLSPDYRNEQENAVRRALLYRRRGPMWRELPRDTQWVQAQLEFDDLPLIHVFPRAQWRKISDGSYRIEDVVKRIRERNYRDGGEAVIAKIQQLRYRLQAGEYGRSAVLLIGVDEAHPMTIFEGNHRLSAAMLVGPHAVTKFTILCGFSPRMVECCFYRTNFPNMWRYIKNRLANAWYDPEADVRKCAIGATQQVLTMRAPASVSSGSVAEKLTGPQKS
jgi:hypothetical protein